MPHCQKESHDHSTKSKKEKARIKAEKAAKKQAALDGLRKKEEEELLKPNNTPLVEGFGEYEIGCKPEREYKFNSKVSHVGRLFQNKELTHNLTRHDTTRHDTT